MADDKKQNKNKKGSPEEIVEKFAGGVKVGLELEDIKRIEKKRRKEMVLSLKE